MVAKNNNYVIGVDGGGTKTVVALANLERRILKMGKSGPASPRNVGIKKAIENIIAAVNSLLPKNKKIKIASIFIGLPAVEEEFKSKIKEIKKAILRDNKISKRLIGQLTIDSDQLVAYRSGTDQKEGIVLIAGTGCVVHGWKGKKEYKVSGWGWLADEGSAFWIGQKVFQAILKDLDGRGTKTLLTDLVFRRFKIKPHSKFGLRARKGKVNLLNQKIYSQNFIEALSSLSLICDLAARKGDKVAKNILIEAGKELSLSVRAVIKELNFFKKKFPLVLVGSVLKSKIILDKAKKEIKKIAPKIQFIIPKEKPVVGAVKLAIEALDPVRNSGRPFLFKGLKTKSPNDSAFFITRSGGKFLTG